MSRKNNINIGDIMSIGIGAYAKKIAEDDSSVIYEYGGYNLNDPRYRNEDHIYDGIITIQKDCFIEPEIHEKVKKMPSGRKKTITKRILVEVHYDEMLTEGRITIENCSNCWHTTEDDLKVDIMACHLLFWIFRSYQEEGAIPGSYSYNV